MDINTLLKVATVSLASLIVAGCFNNSDSSVPSQFSYRLTMTNLTNNQPMSPVAFAIHDQGFVAWQVGHLASDGLEKLAEGGDNTEFLANPAISASISGNGIVMPGMSQVLELTLASDEPMMFTAVSMLVNTNDAFSGLKQQALNNLAVGEQLTLMASVYDGGSEANTESAGTIPGPADNGQGYSVVNDDVGFVAMHAGVVSHDDGLSVSVLNQSHRFEGWGAQFTIERLE